MNKSHLLAAALASSLVVSHSVLADKVYVQDAWSPAFAVSALTQAPVYMTLTNLSAESRQLVSAETSVAKAVTLQGWTQDAQLRKVQHLNAMELPVAAPVSLNAGSAYLMLDGLNAPLRPGSRFTLTLAFDNGERSDVRVQVRSSQVSGERVLEGMRTDPLQQGTPQRRTEGLDDALRTDPLLR